MTAVVFTGPTIAADEARALLDATYLPPVQQGDVYRAARHRPHAIAIIDGYFERVPAVWHKEILFALSEGIPVLGASSMGALRAAELAPFGMVGVGAVFAAFEAGDLEDDDEVAVVHGPPESGYRVLSEAMVNIRATLRRACADGVVDPSIAAQLVGLAKSRFYAERSWPQLLADGASSGIAEVDALRAWLPTGRVDQKRLDAEELLRSIASANGRLEQRPVKYRVEHTIWWDQVMRHAGSAPRAAQGASSLDAAHAGDAADGWDAVVLEAVLDELRLEGEPYADVFRGALIRHVTIAEARASAAPPTSAEVDQRIERLLADCLRTDISASDLDPVQLRALARDDVLVDRGHRLLELGALERLPDHLRVTGRWAILVDRVRRKHGVLAAAGIDNPGIDDTGATLHELCVAHAARIGIDPPDSQQAIGRFAKRLGFGSVDDLARALAREHLFLQRAGTA